MLWKKMARDLWENKGAFAASIVVIIIGLMTYTSFSIVMDNIKLSQQRFYSQQNFADGFAEVRGIPEIEVKKLRDIKGIKKISGRVVKDVRVLMPDREEEVYLRLVSVDPKEERPINGVQLIEGIPLENTEMNIWVDNKFFEANGLQLNREIEIIAGGNKRNLRIVGTGRTPEFIYALRTSADLYPDPSEFGVAFIPLEILQSILPDAQINNIVFTLDAGADYDTVEEKLESELKPFGLISIYPRSEQTSHMLLSEELKGLQAVAKAVPLLFLSIAGMILYIMLKRMIEQQRGQIGILKAFGYTRREIILHYISYALAVGIVGGLVGGLLGIALSFPFTSFYRTFFNMPGLSSKFSPHYLVLAVLLSFAFSFFSGYQGSKKVLLLQPAEAMRPPAPPVGKKVVLEKIKFFWNMLTVQGRMAIRNIFRNKGRSIFIFLGIMFCFAIIVFTWSMNDLVKVMIFDQYEKIEVYDARIVLSRPLGEDRVERELYNFPGVKKVEPMAEIPVKFKNKWLEKDVVIIGLEENSTLYNILDKENNRVELPAHGVLLSERLAGLLNADVGTSLRVESPMFEDGEEYKEVEVAGIVPQYLGINAYMKIDNLRNLVEQKGLTTSIILSIDKEKISDLQKEYRESPLVESVEDKNKRLEEAKDLLASYGSMIYMYALIGVIIGFAIIYSSSIISFSERSGELATMMVLGMTPREVISVITFEQWFIAIFAMITGIPVAKMMLLGISQAISNDIYTMPTTISISSNLISIVVTAFSIWIAQKMAARKVRRLRLIDVLKTRE